MIYNALSFSFFSNNIVHIHITWSVFIKILHYLKFANILIHSILRMKTKDGLWSWPMDHLPLTERLAEDGHLGTSHCMFKIDI